MIKLSFQLTFLLLVLSLASTSLLAQKHNAYKFIEPNISISYDSSDLKITNRYSNSFYETEAYDFSFFSDTIKKARIYVEAHAPTDYPVKQVRDSLILAGLHEIKNTENDTFSILSIDSLVREINGFSCVGIVGYDKINKVAGTSIYGYHFSENDNTELRFSSHGNELDKEYKLITAFLQGFKSYSKKEIEKEVSIVKKKYTLQVVPTKRNNDDFRFPPISYIGIVSTKEKLEHAVSDARLAMSNGYESFLPDKTGKVIIKCFDERKGKIIRKGELVILNSFGKQVKLPFTFSYINNGPL